MNTTFKSKCFIFEHFLVQFKVLLIIALLLSGSVGLFAQKTVTSSGDDATGSGGSCSYTIGQIDYTTYTAGSGSSALGVQHAYELFALSSSDLVASNLKLIAFPNPTVDGITLQIDNLENQKLTFILFDMNGTLLQSNQIIGKTTTIKTQQLKSSTYILTVLENNTVIKKFKLIKN